MASLERHGTGWRVVWREAGRGSKKHKSRIYANKILAGQAMREIDAHLAAAKPYDLGRPLSWSDLIARYCAGRTDRTCDAHRTKLAKVLATLAAKHGWTHASDPTPAQTAALTPYAARVTRALLRYASNHLGQRVNPAALASCRSPAPRRQPADLLTPERVAEIQAAADKWHQVDGLIIHLVSTYGHRVDSILRLTRKDFDGQHLTLLLKSKDQHRHPLLPETIKRLRALPGGGPPVSTGHLGRAWEDGAEFSRWAAHSLGCGILPLRRFAITRLLDGCKGDARTAASITGHRTPSLLLNVYSRTNEDRQRTALSALGVPPVSPNSH